MSRTNHISLFPLMLGFALGSLAVFGVCKIKRNWWPISSVIDGSQVRQIDVLVVAKFGGSDVPPYWLNDEDRDFVPWVEVEQCELPPGGYDPPEIIGSHYRRYGLTPLGLTDILHFPGFSDIPADIRNAATLIKGVTPGRIRISVYAPLHDRPYWVSDITLRSSKMVFVAPPQCVEAEITVDGVDKPLVAEALGGDFAVYFWDVAAKGPRIWGEAKYPGRDGYAYAWLPTGHSYEGYICPSQDFDSDPAKIVGWKLTTLTVGDSYSEMPKFRVSIEKPNDPPILARWSHDP